MDRERKVRKRVRVRGGGERECERDRERERKRESGRLNRVKPTLEGQVYSSSGTQTTHL